MRPTAPAALLLAISAAAAPAGDQTFSSRVEAVRVDVLVTDGGRPVRGLQRADFVVLDNGVRQEVTLISFDQIPLNVVLALDMSESVAGEQLAHLRKAGGVLLDGLKENDRAALVSFSHVVTLGSELTSDLPFVRAQLARAQPTGLTSLVDASFVALTIGESDVGRALLILFSDGFDTTSWLTPEAVMDVARRSDGVVYAVTAGRKRGSFPGELSELTGGRLFELESLDALSGAFAEVLQEFRERYLISYTPRGVATDGWHRLDVRVKGPNVRVRARPGYLAGP